MLLDRDDLWWCSELLNDEADDTGLGGAASCSCCCAFSGEIWINFGPLLLRLLVDEGRWCKLKTFSGGQFM